MGSHKNPLISSPKPNNSNLSLNNSIPFQQPSKPSKIKSFPWPMISDPWMKTSLMKWKSTTLSFTRFPKNSLSVSKSLILFKTKTSAYSIKINDSRKTMSAGKPSSSTCKPSLLVQICFLSLSVPTTSLQLPISLSIPSVPPTWTETFLPESPPKSLSIMAILLKCSQLNTYSAESRDWSENHRISH